MFQVSSLYSLIYKTKNSLWSIGAFLCSILPFRSSPFIRLQLSVTRHTVFVVQIVKITVTTISKFHLVFSFFLESNFAFECRLHTESTIEGVILSGVEKIEKKKINEKGIHLRKQNPDQSHVCHPCGYDMKLPSMASKTSM